MARTPRSGAPTANTRGAAPRSVGGKSIASNTTVARSPKTATPSAPKKRTSIPEFARQVRAEGRKITWTSRKETWITSVMVFIMVAIAAVFFFATDTVIRIAITWLLRVPQMLGG